MIPRLWTCKELVLIAAIVALACVAAFLSIKLTRPKPFAGATFGIESPCKQSLLTTSSRKVVHMEPVRSQAKPNGLRHGSQA
jgi:hypothetical protein